MFAPELAADDLAAEATRQLAKEQLLARQKAGEAELAAKIADATFLSLCEEAAEHAHDDKGVPRHSLDDFADGVLGVVDALTAVDAELYVRGLDRVLRDLADLERCARRTVVCPARWADLARETANVPGARAVVDRWRPTSRARAVKAPKAGDYR